jgi:hypothetical protein
MERHWIVILAALAACSNERPATQPRATGAPEPSEPSEAVPMACVHGFWADQSSAECHYVARGGLCFSSAGYACKCECGDQAVKCEFLYSYPGQVACSR